MHFKNGREAKNGDKVVMIQGGMVFTGVLHGATAGNDYCNGQLAPLPQSTYANLKECLHMEDFIAATKALDVPDTSKPIPAEDPTAPPAAAT